MIIIPRLKNKQTTLENFIEKSMWKIEILTDEELRVRICAKLTFRHELCLAINYIDLFAIANVRHAIKTLSATYYKLTMHKLTVLIQNLWKTDWRN